MSRYSSSTGGLSSSIETEADACKEIAVPIIPLCVQRTRLQSSSTSSSCDTEKPQPELLKRSSTPLSAISGIWHPAFSLEHRPLRPNLTAFNWPDNQGYKFSAPPRSRCKVSSHAGALSFPVRGETRLRVHNTTTDRSASRLPRHQRFKIPAIPIFPRFRAPVAIAFCTIDRSYPSHFTVLLSRFTALR